MVNLKQLKFILIQVCKHITEKIKYLHTFSDLPSNLLKSWNNGTWYKRKEKLVASKPEVPSTLRKSLYKIEACKNCFVFLKLGFFCKSTENQYNTMQFFPEKNTLLCFSNYFYLHFFTWLFLVNKFRNYRYLVQVLKISYMIREIDESFLLKTFDL